MIHKSVIFLFLQLVNRINWQSFPNANNVFSLPDLHKKSGNGEKSRRKIKNFTLQIASFSLTIPAANYTFYN